ncbi:MAG: L-serine ammonia-lyase, iron-sulfur-dependent subunit beta [Clostridia bacterium]|nr:L-serine ammonia-lyase, iron-sulfur-dependent subunit beta [Clostridia bacterium]
MTDIFDILGPVMIGPSSSHTAGAVRIGLIGRTLLEGEPKHAKIGLFGSFAETGRGHGTDRAIVAGLLGFQPDFEGIPRSFEIAGERGLEFEFYTAYLRDAHPNTALLDIVSFDGETLSMTAASTGGGRIRVEKIDGIDVSFTGEENTLIVRHRDVKGRVADIAGVISAAGINIADMSLCRAARGGDALEVIETDQRVPSSVREKIEGLDGILRVSYCEKKA